jgi:sporulation protein YlmC with PRC-barrel domain
MRLVSNEFHHASGASRRQAVRPQQRQLRAHDQAAWRAVVRRRFAANLVLRLLRQSELFIERRADLSAADRRQDLIPATRARAFPPVIARLLCRQRALAAGTVHLCTQRARRNLSGFKASQRNRRWPGTARACRGFSRHQFLMEENTMLTKAFAAGLAGTALLATVAFAQSPSATTDKAPAAATTTTTAPTSASGEWRASKMVGLKVYNDANESVGSINDLLMDKSGNIKLAVIGVGGFLGMGEHLVAVPYEKLKFVNEAVAYTGAGASKPASTTTTGAATTERTTTTTTSSSSKWYPDHAVFNATKDELKNMPEFKYSE